ncbi:hypothetical protein [Methylobacterium sp. A54F]
MEKIFLEYSRFFHQDCEVYGPNLEDAIAISLRMLGKEKAQILDIYLKRVLENVDDDNNLAEMWYNSRSSIYFTDKTIYRPFLQAICDMAGTYMQSPD